MCAIQGLLNPRVVESKVKVVEPMVVESKAVESILYSMQGKERCFFQDIFPIRDWPKGAVVYIYSGQKSEILDDLGLVGS